MPFNDNESVVLVGLPGSGKSRVGELLAEHLGWNLADIDCIIELQAGMAIRELVAAEGWQPLRDREQRVLAGQLQRERVVIATGGGAVESAENRAAMKSAGMVVWLQAPVQVLLERLAPDPAQRPLLSESPAARLEELAARREPLYAEIADHRIDTGGLDEAAVADMIRGIVRREQENAR